MQFQKVGFQNREERALLEEGGSASVRNWYTRPGLPRFAPYSIPINLLALLRYQCWLFELPL
ncbi:hypothetical protein NV377_19080 [Paenibacillus sp. T3-5-0-4]|nr:hypothetical protein [Paenibacillus endoradicis]